MGSLKRVALLLAVVLLGTGLFGTSQAHAATTALKPGDTARFNLYENVGSCTAYRADAPSGDVGGKVKVTLTGPNADGFGTATARIAVRIPVGDYSVAIADLTLAPATGDGGGCSYFLTDFTVTNDRKITHVSVSTLYYTGTAHTLQIFVLPRGGFASEGILATKPIEVSAIA
jgi:hypothetical protein